MNRIVPILLALLLISFSPIHAQTEAEGVSEVLVFQEKEGQKRVEVKPGDKIKIHQNTEKENDVLGEVVAIHENSLEIFRRSNGKKYIVDLRKIEGISSPRSRNNSTGLIISGAILTMLFLILAILTAYSTAFFGPVLFLFSFIFLLLCLSLLIAGLVRRGKVLPKIILKFWTWRLVRKKKVIVKKKKTR